jgi:hypothetical protein
MHQLVRRVVYCGSVTSQQGLKQWAPASGFTHGRDEAAVLSQTFGLRVADDVAFRVGDDDVWRKAPKRQHPCARDKGLVRLAIVPVLEDVRVLVEPIRLVNQ